MRKSLWLIAGFSGVALGVIGIFVPLLPTTPFLLLAAFCFGRSSPRFYRWLTSNPYLNSYLEHYRSGNGVPRKIIVRALLVLWGGLALSAWLLPGVAVWVMLGVVGVAVSVHLLSLRRSAREPRNFTLIELLISMGIIAVLSAMLLPSLARAREAAMSASCLGNLRQIGAGLELYTADNRGFIPETNGPYWGSSLPIVRMYGGVTFALGKLIEQYRLGPELFGCPGNRSRDAGYVRRNWRAGGVTQTAYLYRETDCSMHPILANPANRARAIVMDFACISATGAPLIPHEFREVNLLRTDGGVERRANSPTPGIRFTVQTPASSMMVPPCDFAWENADRARP